MYLHKDVFIGIFTAVSNSSTVFPTPSVSAYLSASLCDSNLVSFHPKLLSNPPLLPDIHVPSLTLISLAGNLFLLGKLVHLWCFWIPPDCCSMYTIHISLSDFLEAVWSSEELSMRKNWHNFLGASGWVIIHCMYVAHLPYPFICEWTFWWFPRLDSLGSPAGDTGVQVY